MSKSNMLLGLAKGKVGDLVFYRDGGEQRTRTRVIPKNPRTPAQMAQRVKMANVSALYRVLAPVLSSSFSNRPTNQSGYNAFASTAIGYAPYQTRAMAAADVVLPQPAFASKGVLPTMILTGEFTETSPIGVEVLKNGITNASTIADLSAALIEERPSLRYGDKLTFVSLRFEDTGVEVDEVAVYTPNLDVVSLVLSSTDTTNILDKYLSITEGVLHTDGFLTISEGGVGMVAVIHSRVDENGQLQTSTQQFQLSPSAADLYTIRRSEARLDEAIQSYALGAESILR